MAFKVITPPALEPLSMTDDLVKQAARIIDPSEDAFYSLLLSRAREAAEMITWRALVAQQILLTIDQFPAPTMNVASANWYGPSWGVSPGPLTTAKPDGKTMYEIWLPRPPLISVDSIKYYDPQGILQTLDPAQYQVDTISEPARVTPAYNSVWPATQNRANAVEIRFTAGYGTTAASVPASIRHWILVMAQTMYENREMVAVLNRGSVNELPFMNGLLDGFKVRSHDVPSYWL